MDIQTLPKRTAHYPIGRHFVRKKHPELEALLRVSRSALASAAQAVPTLPVKYLWRCRRTGSTIAASSHGIGKRITAKKTASRLT